jgi:integrase
LEKGGRAVTYVPKLRGYIENYYQPFFSEMDVREIFPMHVNEWYLSLPQKSLNTIKNICDALRNFFNWLHTGRIIEHSMPFPAVEIPEHEPECLSPEMQMAILEKIPEIHRPIYAFLFYQGCRIGEARALKWDCINGDVVTYRRTFSANKLAEFTKTKKIRHNLLFPGNPCNPAGTQLPPGLCFYARLRRPQTALPGKYATGYIVPLPR